jgi:hypothetical protein
MNLSPLENRVIQDLANFHTDTLTDRANAWASAALTRAKVLPVAETDSFTATLPPFRKFCGLGGIESTALAELRVKLIEFARMEMLAGRDLPTWEGKIPDITPAMKCLVRMSNLRHELKTRASEWGGERQLLPAGAAERCLVEIDQLVTRHAMQIQGVPPPPRRNAETRMTNVELPTPEPTR